ncbi:MAG: hypothetical protein EOO11_07005 [Chitinophagaceae bacterium]|nr:MAG: hypothetical protein EOO11_07005 [Chitinophagaceae bacterium]
MLSAAERQHWSERQAALQQRLRLEALAPHGVRIPEIEAALRAGLLPKSRWTHVRHMARLLQWLCRTDLPDTRYDRVAAALGCSESGAYKLLAALKRHGLACKAGFLRYALTDRGIEFLEGIVRSRKGSPAGISPGGMRGETL